MSGLKADRILVSLLRLEFRLKGATGLVGALHLLKNGTESVPTPVLDAVVQALAFHMDQLCDELGFDSDGRRPQ